MRKTDGERRVLSPTGLGVPSAEREPKAAIISGVSNATEALLRAYRPLNDAGSYFDTTAYTEETEGTSVREY
jgi:hypothetical protein